MIGAPSMFRLSNGLNAYSLGTPSFFLVIFMRCAPCLPPAPSDVAVHILATFMLLLAVLSTFIQIWHRFSRRNLRLRHEPGTIASAVAIGGQTVAGELLSGQRSEKDLSNVLRGKKFRIEPLTMKIIMEGEDGYEDASSPGMRRRSVFYGFQQGLWLKDNGEEMERGEGIGGLGRSISKRISTMGARMPTSPKSPKSPPA